MPGWSFGIIGIGQSVSAFGNVARARSITIGQFNPTLNLNINAAISANVNIGVMSPSYVFATPFLGGQAALSLAGMVAAAPL